MNLVRNVFENPEKYLNELLTTEIFPKEVIQKAIDEYKGSSMLCAWITKKCPLMCDKCFFKSNMNCDDMIPEEYELTDKGIEKLIEFVNASNSGYLMLSGGGDPMLDSSKVCRLIEKVDTNRIVIVTSGFWANDYEKAKEIIFKLHAAYNKREASKKCELVLRLSIDEFHTKALKGYQAFYHIINIFHDYFKDDENFKLMIHTIKDDKSVDEISKKLNAEILSGEKGESDNAQVIKIVPQKKALVWNNGYRIEIGVSKLFYSDLMIDLNKDSLNIQNAIKVITDDIENSEQDNPSYIQNTSGKKGLDFWLDYNGNVTTWFNQDWNSLYNIYEDDYHDIVYRTFKNPVSARFLKKGYEYRNSIVSEVNTKAVLRAKAINLRDYAGALLLEEHKTKLYFAIRGLKDYINEYVLEESNFNKLSEELQDAIIIKTKAELINLYEKADYDITDQYLKEENFDQQVWSDLFLLISRGHYFVNEHKLHKKIEFYNKITHENIKGIDDFNCGFSEELYGRLHKRISFMQEKAYQNSSNKKD